MVFKRFKSACVTIGVAAIDYIELEVNEITRRHVDRIEDAPAIDDPGCHILPGDDWQVL